MGHSTPAVLTEFTESAEPALLLALVQADTSTTADTEADALQRAWVQQLQHSGWRVGGVLQRCSTWPSGCKRMQLLDVGSPQVFDISQDLGSAAKGCCLDPAGVVEASSVLRQALADGVDVVVTNRFGGLETQGGGFVAEIAALVEAGIPVLTIVAPQHLPAWRTLTGPLGQALEMPQGVQALDGWLASVRAGLPPEERSDFSSAAGLHPNPLAEGEEAIPQHGQPINSLSTLQAAGDAA